MLPHIDTKDQRRNLCRRCGFCCDGTIFNKVQIDEQDAAAKLPLFQLLSIDGDFYFPQPCGAYDKLKGCRIYPVRPVRCREFSCTLLSRFNDNELSWNQAIAVTEHAGRLKKSLYEEATHHHIERKFLVNTRDLVHHIESALSRSNKTSLDGSMRARCAEFSAFLRTFYIKNKTAHRSPRELPIPP